MPKSQHLFYSTKAIMKYEIVFPNPCAIHPGIILPLPYFSLMKPMPQPARVEKTKMNSNANTDGLTSCMNNSKWITPKISA